MKSRFLLIKQSSITFSITFPFPKFEEINDINYFCVIFASSAAKCQFLFESKVLKATLYVICARSFKCIIGILLVPFP
jgi:hypothetical protein